LQSKIKEMKRREKALAKKKQDVLDAIQKVTDELNHLAENDPDEYDRRMKVPRLLAPCWPPRRVCAQCRGC
jgi:hypothetical protein